MLIKKELIRINVIGLPNTGKTTMVNVIDRLFRQIGFETSPKYLEKIYRTPQEDSTILDILKNKIKIEIIEKQADRDFIKK